MMGLALVLAVGLGKAEPPKVLIPKEQEPLQPLPKRPPGDAKKIELGYKLFSEVRVSKNNSLACKSCHDLQRGGADARPYSKGMGGAEMPFNTPDLLNLRYKFRFGWTGSSERLTDSLDKMIADPRAMNTSWQEVALKLKLLPEYRDAFKTAYSGGIRAYAVRDALEAFLLSLQTEDSKVDRYLKGDNSALSSEELSGYKLFIEYGCVACHQGQNVGGNMLQRFGVFVNYLKERGKDGPEDRGRFNDTHDPADIHVFRVPSLRNVSETAPYLHDGSVETLPEVIALMAGYSRGALLHRKKARR